MWQKTSAEYFRKIIEKTFVYIYKLLYILWIQADEILLMIKQFFFFFLQF